MDESTAPVEAVKALRARGVDTAEEMLSLATPDQILAACRRWDGRQGVGPGLLVRWIRSGDFDEPAPAPTVSKRAQLRARFDEYVARFPVGSVAESHDRQIARRWPEDIERADELDMEICNGNMIVVGATYPILEMECDRCGFLSAVGPRDLHVLEGE